MNENLVCRPLLGTRNKPYYIVLYCIVSKSLIPGFAFTGVKHMAKVLTEEPSRCQIALFDANWPRFLKSNTGLRKTPLLSVISAEINSSDSQTSSTESLAQRIILEKDHEKRAELVKEYVGVSVTEWTGISSPSETDLNKSLYSYGVDSTAALTLKMQLETNLQVSFEVSLLSPS